ncbi:MAG: type I methionyl aminopeptidase [Clostridia bacterium]|nr:type I methionyl aminopeptidase [Bacillota bacterium]MBO2520882.1 type I methionyl aminopeptidase [Bacillota bacterium]
MIILKSPEEIEAMRRAGRVVALAHRRIAEAIRPGIRTKDLDALALEVLKAEGAIPSFKGYQGYPANICVSVNEQVVHGIPGNTVLREGDIVSVDIGAIVDGFHGDAAWTYPVGEVDEAAQALLRAGEGALYAGIEKARPGNRLSDISHAVQVYVESRGFSVVRDFVGHGIGRSMHEAPQVPNFGPPNRGPRLKPGMTLAIEPMVNAGGYEVEILSDRWTVVTRDRSLSVHFEHTVAITEDGPVVLTAL